MAAEVGGVLGTVTYPHLILPYSAYYGLWPPRSALWGSLVLPYIMLVQSEALTCTEAACDGGHKIDTRLCEHVFFRDLVLTNRCVAPLNLLALGISLFSQRGVRRLLLR
jgi:hypothetical protein